MGLPVMGGVVARLLGPVVLAVLAAAVAVSWGPIGATLGFAADTPAASWGPRIAEAAAWLAAAWGLVRALDMALWHGVLERRSGVPVPRLLTDLVAGVVLVAGRDDRPRATSSRCRSPASRPPRAWRSRSSASRSAT